MTLDDAIARLERDLDSGHPDSPGFLLEHLAAYGAAGIEERVAEMATQALANRAGE